MRKDLWFTKTFSKYIFKLNNPLILFNLFPIKEAISMSERKRKREELLGLAEETGFLLEASPVEVGSGYSISISYDEEETPIIHVKTYGEVDLIELRKEIRKVYPNAKIEGMPKTPNVKIISIHKKKKRRNRKTMKKTSHKKSKSK
jgi:hypothetical protein